MEWRFWKTNKSESRAVSKRLAEFADRRWDGGWDDGSVDVGLSNAHNESERQDAARQYVTIQICDAPIKRMKVILERIARETSGKWLSQAVKRRLEKLEDVTAFKPIAGGVKHARTCDDAKALRSLLDDLGTGTDYSTRKSAAEKLGKLGDVAAVDALIAALKNDRDDHVRRSVAETLGMIGDLKAVEPLLGVLQAERDDIAVCAKYYAEHGAPLSTGLLACAVTDALHTMGVRAPMKLLVPLYRDYVLVKVGDIDSIDGLVSALRSKDWHVSESAACALGMIGDPSTVKPLMAALAEYRALPPKERYERGYGAACKVIHALGNMGNSVPTERLIAILEEEIRMMGARASDPSMWFNGRPDFHALGELDAFPASLVELLGAAHDARAIEPLKRAVMLAYAPYSGLGYQAELALTRLGEFRISR